MYICLFVCITYLCFNSVKSMFQTELENMMGKSGLKLQLDAPKEIIDDPTLEVRRLEAFVSDKILSYCTDQP